MDRTQYRKRLQEPDPKQFDTYWDLINYSFFRYCFRPYCTTCGCFQFRRMIECMDRANLEKIIRDVTIDEIRCQNNFYWHDALEVIEHTLGRSFMEGAFMLQQYDFVFDKYYELRRVYHLKPHECRYEILKILKQTDS